MILGCRAKYVLWCRRRAQDVQTGRGDILGRSMLGNANLLRRAPDSIATVERHAKALSAVVAACGALPMCHAVMSS